MTTPSLSEKGKSIKNGGDTGKTMKMYYNIDKVTAELYKKANTSIFSISNQHTHPHTHTYPHLLLSHNPF